MPDNDRRIERCGQGDAEALRELIARYEGPLRGFLFRTLGHTEDAEDALADAFLRLWRTAATYRGQCSESTWVYKLAVSAATDLLRRRKTAGAWEPLDEGVSAAAPAESQPETVLMAGEGQARSADLVRRAMAKLPPEERVAVTLFHIEEHGYQEVAQITGVPVTTVRMRLFRARKRMKAHLQRWMDDEEIPRAAGGGALDAGPCPDVLKP